MGRVRTKRNCDLPEFLRPVVESITNADSESALLAALTAFKPPFHFERPEERSLLNWIEVLNVLDDVLVRHVVSLPLSSALLTTSTGSQSTPVPSAPSSPSLNDTVTNAFEQGPRNDDSHIRPASHSDQGNVTESPPPSRDLVLVAMKISLRLVRNASHDTKHVYSSSDTLTALLSDHHVPTVIAALEVLYAVHQRTPRPRVLRSSFVTELINRLYCLSHGFGGRENGLGLVECCSKETSNFINDLPSDGGALRLDFRRDDVSRLLVAPSESASASGLRSLSNMDRARGHGDAPMVAAEQELQHHSSDPRVSNSSEDESLRHRSVVVDNGTRSRTSIALPYGRIDISDVDSLQFDENYLLGQFATAKNVPKDMLFSLLTSFRRAKAFKNGVKARIDFVCLRLLAISIIAQLQPSSPVFAMIFANDPELVSDMVAMAKADAALGLESIPHHARVLALRCLTAVCNDRQRFSHISTCAGVSSHHGTLPSMLRTQVAYLESSRLNPSKLETNLNCNVEDEAGTYVQDSVHSVQLAEAMIGLVHALAGYSASQGASSLISSGTLGALVPLIGNREPLHARAVAQGIRAMECIIESTHSSTGCSAFADHGGLSLTIDRIITECGARELSDGNQYDSEADDDIVEHAALEKRGESRSFYELIGMRQLTPMEALEHPSPSSTTASRGLLPHSQWILLRGLMRLLVHALGGGSGRVREVASGALPCALRMIIARPFHYGGYLFSIAASTAADIAHAEPTATSDLVKAGIANALLRSIKAGLPPSVDAIRCVPNVLAAMSLAPEARREIVSSSPLLHYVGRLASPFYGRAMHGETPVQIGNALEELMRHVESLREEGSKALIGFLKAAASFVKAEPPADLIRDACAASNASCLTEMSLSCDSEEKSSGDSQAALDAKEKLLSLEKMKLIVANNAARLVGFAQGSSDHQSNIVSKGGLELMLDLRYAPAGAVILPRLSGPTSHQSRNSPAPSSTIVSLVNSFRSFCSRHGPHVLRCLFDAVREDAAAVLDLGSQLEGAWLEQEEQDVSCPRKKVSDAFDNVDVSGDLQKGSRSEKVPVEHISVEKTHTASAELYSARRKIRELLTFAICRLRVDVVILTGLSRSGPGSSAGNWEAASGSEVATMIGTVERAARYHLAVVYTGLTLETGQDRDLCSAVVTATCDPDMQPIASDKARAFAERIATSVGVPSQVNRISDAVRKKLVPPDPADCARQNVRGDAWALATYAVAAQRLYSALSRGLTVSSRRFSRDAYGQTASTRALAGTIGRIFALHLMTAENLWNKNVVSCGGGQITAAWDYIRGVLIEIKGCIFDESRRVTQSLVLKSFLAAGGGHALVTMCRPRSLISSSGLSSRVDLKESFSRSIFGVSGVSSFSRCDDKGRGITKELAPVVTATALLAASEVLQDQDFSQRSSKDAVSDVCVGNRDIRSAFSDSNSSNAHHLSFPETNRRRRIALSSFRIDNPGVCAQNVLVTGADIATLDRMLRNVYEHILDTGRRNSVETAARDTWNTFSTLVQLLASCPGTPLDLSTSPVIPSSGPGAIESWSHRDIHRSSQSVAIRIVNEIISDSSQQNASQFSSEAFMSDVISVVSVVSSSAEELANNGENSPGQRRPLRDPFSAPVRHASDRQESVQLPDLTESELNIVNGLVEMGFEESRAIEALRHITSLNLEFAMDWLLMHSPESDGNIGDDSDAQDAAADDDGEMDEDDVVEEDEHDRMGSAEENYDDSAVDEDLDDESIREVNDFEAQLNHRTDATGMRPIEDVDLNLANADNARNSAIGTPSDRAMDDLDGQQVLSEQGDPEQSADRRNSISCHGNSGVHSPASLSNSDAGIANSNILEMTAGSPVPESSQENGTSDCSFAFCCNSTDIVMQSIREEIEALNQALESMSEFPSSSVEKILSESKSLFKSSSLLAFDCSEFHPPHRRDVKALTRTEYLDQKNGLFASIESLARLSILGDGTTFYGTDCASVAVELLLAMERDGYLTNDMLQNFAELIADSFRATLSGLSQSDMENSERPVNHTVTKSGAMWAHHGGSSVRHALASCGIAEIALQILQRVCEIWEEEPHRSALDEDPVGPIRQLSIHEGQSRPTQTSMNFPLGGRSETTLSSRRGPLVLKTAMTCLLMLDSLVRFSWRDAVQVFASESVRESESREESTHMDQLHVRETELSPSVVAAEAEAGKSSDQTSEAPSRPQMQLEESLADALGSELEVANAVADQQILHAVNNVVAECSKWFDGDELQCYARSDKARREHFEMDAFTCCLKLLRMWQDCEVGDALPAVLQLIASLTRSHHIALRFCEENGPGLLLSLPQLSFKRGNSTDSRTLRCYVRTVLRHVVEDPETLREAMEADIRSLVSAKQSRGRPAFTVRAFMAAAAPMMERNMDVFFQALANVARLHTDGHSVEELVRSEADHIPTSGTQDERLNVNIVSKALCHCLVLKVEKAVDEVAENLVQTSHLLSSAFRAKHDSSSVASNTELVQFALSLLTEFVSLFPGFAARFVRAPSPCKDCNGTTLDYIIRDLLPLQTTKSSQVLSSMPISWGSSDDVSDLCRDLVLALSSRAARCHKDVVDAVSKAAAAELAQSNPRPSAIKAFSMCISQSRRPIVIQSYLDSGVTNSLISCLKKLDLNAPGMNEVINGLLRALDELSRLALFLLRKDGDHIDDDDGSVPRYFRDTPREDFAIVSRGQFGRRWARGLFESLQHAELSTFDPFSFRHRSNSAHDNFVVI